MSLEMSLSILSVHRYKTGGNHMELKHKPFFADLFVSRGFRVDFLSLEMSLPVVLYTAIGTEHE